MCELRNPCPADSFIRIHIKASWTFMSHSIQSKASDEDMSCRNILLGLRLKRRGYSHHRVARILNSLHSFDIGMNHAFQLLFTEISGNPSPSAAMPESSATAASVSRMEARKQGKWNNSEERLGVSTRDYDTLASSTCLLKNI